MSIIKKIFVLLIGSLLLFSCCRHSCSAELGFRIDYYLFEDIKIDGKSYCNLINKALKGDKKSIIGLSKVKVFDFASYQHGAVLIEVIDDITESEYLKLTRSLSVEEKHLIYYYVMAGLEYTPNKKYSGKEIEKAFPVLTREIKDDTP